MPKQKSLGVVNVSAVLQAQKDIRKDDRFKLAIEAFAKRDRFYAVNNISNGVSFYYQNDKWFTPSDARAVYQWLQSIGVGAIRLNRETKKPVFLFFTDYRSFGKLVLGKNDKLLKTLVADGADLPPTPLPRTPMPDLAPPGEDEAPEPAPKAATKSAPAPQADGAMTALHDFINSVDTVTLLKTLSPAAKAKFIALLELL